MVTYAEYTAFSNVPISQSDFPFCEARAVDLLSLLCGQLWDTEDETCKKAVLYQIEFVQQNGGLTEWSRGAGSVGSHSWSVGGESESITVGESSHAEKVKVVNGLAVSPMAWGLLSSNGFLRSIRGIRIW